MSFLLGLIIGGCIGFFVGTLRDTTDKNEEYEDYQEDWGDDK